MADNAYVLKPWRHITIKLSVHSAWRYRWSIGFWLIRLGSRLISKRVTVAVMGSNDA